MKKHGWIIIVLCVLVSLQAIAFERGGQWIDKQADPPYYPNVYGDHSLVVLPDGKVLTLGGMKITGAMEAVRLYDPETNTYETLPDMLQARARHGAVLLPGNKILVIGGAWDSERTAELYDVDTGDSHLIDLNYKRGLFTPVLLPNGKVLAAGGWLSPQTAELYEPATQSFTVLGNLAYNRTGATSTLLNDGRVLITGGGSRTAEFFDPATETFYTIPAAVMVKKREYPTATLLDGGKVLITGGYSGGVYLNDGELFDPVTNTFTLIGDTFYQGRNHHRAVKLLDGTVLISGGVNDSWYNLSSCNLYDPNSQSFYTAMKGPSVRFGSYELARLKNGKVIAILSETYQYEVFPQIGKTGNTATQDWKKIWVKDLFTKDPLVALTGIQTWDGTDTAGVRVKGLDGTGMYVKIEEEQSLDSEVKHATEVVSYAVFADGKIRNKNGAVIGEAVKRKCAQSSPGMWSVVFTSRQYTDPVVFIQLTSYNNAEPCHFRLRNVTGNSFAWKIEEWDYLNGIHPLEDTGYVVLEAGIHQMANGYTLEVGKKNGLTGNWGSIWYQTGGFQASPIVITQCQTYNDSGAVTVRQWDGGNIYARSIRLQEEEVQAGSGHGQETVGYMAYGKVSQAIDKEN